MSKKAINENIKKFRIFRGIKQNGLAKMLGKSKNTISNWERGDNDPDPDTIEKICKILDVTPNQLFGWDENPEYLDYEKNKRIKEEHIMKLQERMIKYEQEINSIRALIHQERQELYDHYKNDDDE